MFRAGSPGQSADGERISAGWLRYFTEGVTWPPSAVAPETALGMGMQTSRGINSH